MRSEKEMMSLIITKAKQDDRILAAYMKGSRTNPKVPKDIYRDFDIMYVVKETDSFIMDTSWINFFGKVVLKQEQDDDYGYGERFGIRANYDESYSWLLLFSDGNRIDVGIETINALNKGTNRNKLYLPLLDKIGCLPELPAPTDEDFFVKKPSIKQFQGCCNEFFWCICDVSKGIARDEMPFAMTTYNTLVRNMMELMLNWYIGTRTDFSVSTGKLNKYFKKYLSEAIYQRYLKTYTNGEYENFWCAIQIAIELFHDVAIWVGESIEATYPYTAEEAACGYMKNIRTQLATLEKTDWMR